jgi:hypothetical protein
MRGVCVPRKEGEAIRGIVDRPSRDGDVGEEAKHADAVHEPVHAHLARACMYLCVLAALA